VLDVAQEVQERGGDRGGVALPTTSSLFAALAMRCRRSLAVVAADLGGPNSSFSRWWW
jgi:hypothetical protein